MGKIKFGTDGWRAIMAEDFTFANVRIVAQAIADYVLRHHGQGKEVVIGYDNRFFSDRFAVAVAEVLTANGIPVLVPERATPTPVTAYAIKMYGAVGAVMITASHNPPEYNGIKFIPEYAGPALPHITQEIEACVREYEEGKKPVKRIASEEAREKGLWRSIDPKEGYWEHLRQVVDVEQIRKANLNIIVDPLYGTGMEYLDGFLKAAGCQVKAIHNCRDPLFGGAMPDPTEKVLGELRQLLKEEGADLGLAMDGDADRFGIVDRDGTCLTPNQVLAILYHHLITYRGWRGPVARTVATTHLLDRIARHHNLEVIETPVGFKYIGQAMMERGAILGGEESGGLSIKGHIPEKDGILATLLIAETVAVHKKSLQEILADLCAEYGFLTSRRLDVHCTQQVKERVLAELRNFSPAEIGGKKVAVELDIDGKKFICEDGSWVLIRPSGTEPLFRIYAEGGSKDDVAALQEDLCRALDLEIPASWTCP